MLIGFAVVGLGGLAYAVWTGSDAKSYEFATADTVGTGKRPTITATGSTATVSWAPSTLTSGAPVTGYDVARYDVGGASQPVSAGCSGTISTLTCTENDVPDGTWQYTVTPRIGLWVGTESPKSLETTVGTTKLVFTTPPRSTVAGVTTNTITVEREDVNGYATTVSALTISLSTDSAGGTFRNAGDTATITDIIIPNGSSSATFRYRDTKSGSATVSASAPSTPTVTPATQVVVVSNAAADHLAFTQQPSDTQAGSVFATQPQVTVQDVYNNTVLAANDTITLSVASGPSGVVSCTSNTGAASSGTASFSGCSIAKSGTYTLQATASGFAPATSASLVIATGPASKLSFSQQPTNATAGVVISPAVTVRIEDAFDNLVTTSTDSVGLAFGANPGLATLAGTVAKPAVGGIATFGDLSIATAASGYTLRATSGTLTLATSDPFSITAAAPHHLIFAQQPTTSASASSITPPVRVRIVDQFDNLTTSTAHVLVSLFTNPSAGTLTGTTDVIAVAGEATFIDLTLDKVGIGYVLRSTSAGVLSADSTPFNITPGAPARLTFSAQPSSAVAGTSLGTITVQVKDAADNLVTGSSAPVTLAVANNAGGGSLSGTASVSAVSGVATFTGLSINKTGTGYTLAAASSGLTGDTSSAFNITPAAANKLSFSSQPTITVAGIAISPAVTVRIEDSFGNLTTSTANVTVALTAPGAATLSGTTNQPAVAGLAIFTNLSVDKIGSYTLTATSGSLTAGVSSTFAISAAGATTLTFSTQPTNVQAATLFSPVVSVSDAFGNPVSGRSVVLTVTGNPSVGFACTTSSTTVASNAAGSSTFTGCRINTAGTYTLTATSTSLTVTSNSFVVSAGPAALVSFAVSPSSPTTANVAFSTQPTVLVTDANNNPVAAAPVILSVTGNPSVGFTCTSVSGSTNASGLLPFAGCKLTKAGTYTFTATAAAITATSTNFTINAAATASISFTTQPSASNTAGVAFTTQPVVTAVDAFANPVSAQSVTLSVTGNPTVGFSCTTNPVTTAAVTGATNFAGCKLTKAGNYTFTATAGAFTATSSSFTINAATTATLTFSTQPSTPTTAGIAITTQPVVTAIDAFANPVNGQSVTLSVTSNPTVGFTCTTNPATTNSTGIATYAGCTLTKAGTYTFTATAGAITTTSTNFTINPGAATKVQMSTCLVTGGTTQTTCGTTFNVGNSKDNTLTFTVDLVDNFGNPVNATTNVALTTSPLTTTDFAVTPTTVVNIAPGTSRSGPIVVTKRANGNPTPVLITVAATGQVSSSFSFTVDK